LASNSALKFAFPKDFTSFFLDNFKEHSGTWLNRLGENLKQKTYSMKDFIKKYWEGALVAQIGLGFMLFEHFSNNEISSTGISIFAIGNITLLGKLFHENK
jgi:hypothetical protein